MSFLSKNRITYNIRNCVYTEVLKDKLIRKSDEFF